MRYAALMAVVLYTGIAYAQELPENTNEIKTLTPEQARRLVRREAHTLELNGLTSLDAETAKRVAEFKGSVELNGLVTLQAKAAKEFAVFKGGRLHLRGLPKLDVDTAQSLAEATVHSLDLSGLTELDRAAAKALAEFKGHELVLDGLNAKDAEAAVALWDSLGSGFETKFDRWLPSDTASIKTLTVAQAKYLVKHHKGNLCLNGLMELPEEVAEVLALLDAGISLDGITMLSDQSANAIGKHKDYELTLQGLKTLSDKAAEGLSQHTGPLSLNGLSTLSDKAAAALVKTNGPLSFDGLTSLSDVAAITLAKHDHYICFDSLPTLSDAAAEAFGRRQGIARFRGLKPGELSDRAEKALVSNDDLDLAHWLESLGR